MKLTLSWLADHLDSAAALDEIVDRLTMLGLEVEGVTDPGAGLGPFTVAYVEKVEKHPDADRLTVCLVDTGQDKVQVVCGAANARTGMKGVFARPGLTLPGTGMALKKATIRGVESAGMLCSELEMGLSDDHEAIIELPDDAPVGEPFAPTLGLDDPVIDVAVMPNRPDCLGVRGIARDLSAAGLGTLKPLQAAPVKGTFESPIKWRRDFPSGAGGACPMVVGRSFRGVENGPSPRWLQDRLKAIGLRPISALVDITNLVTHDLGRPLHVFDADQLAGDLVMRFARSGEEILALDGGTHKLEPNMVVIADAEAVHGIGGVMGGEASGCTEATVNLFLEVALFDPVRTAATGRRLQIDSDARYRFERGVDPTSAIWGAAVATRLIRELCGGEASEIVVAGEEPEWRREVTLRPERVPGLGGVEVPAGECRRILEALGFTVGERDGAITASVPPWRPDIDGEADLVEEVVRVCGYDRVAAVPLTRTTAPPGPVLTPGQRRIGRAKRALAARGMVEAVTWSFTSAAEAELFGGANPALSLANPVSSELDHMRPSILPNLIAAAGRNADRGFPDLALFEVGPSYADDTPAGQASVAAGVRAGRTGARHWDRPPRSVDAFDAKADALAVLDAVGAPRGKLDLTQDAPEWYHPGRSGTIGLGKGALAHFGELDPRVLRRLGVEGRIAGFEVFLDSVPLPRAKPGKARPPFRPSPFQAVERDFAFILDQAVAAEKVVRAARGADKKLIARVSVFDLYTGKGVGPGKKSIAISVTLQPTDRTLTEAEIDAVAAKIVAQVKKATGGVLRG